MGQVNGGHHVHVDQIDLRIEITFREWSGQADAGINRDCVERAPAGSNPVIKRLDTFVPGEVGLETLDVSSLLESRCAASVMPGSSATARTSKPCSAN